MFGVPSGPAHLRIPSDVLNATARAEPHIPPVHWEAARPVDAGTLADVAEEVLAGANKVAVLAGRGCVISGAGEELHAFAETF
jgi:thiamine pyrophosphate-dependent acetolactate synthase large subunit-like protein